MGKITIDKIQPRGHQGSVEVARGGDGPPLLFLHGAGGHLLDDPFLAKLADHYSVAAPLLPGFGGSEGEENLRDMLDFTLHAFDVWEALKLASPLVVGHSMGGMIAAEMAAIAPHEIDRLALIAPAGLWRDEYPAEDLYNKLPFELPGLLFHDVERFKQLLSGGGDLNDPEYLTTFMVANSRRMGTASKLLFPIPERGLQQRLYRIRARTQIIWGAEDRLLPVQYGDDFKDGIEGSTLTVVPECGHMVPYERTEEVLEILARLHN